jgi:hypothetical protein
MLVLYSSKKCPIQIILNFLLLFSLLNMFSFAEARTIANSIYFKGEYKNKLIYGSLNYWDGRACTVINNKVIIGQVNKDIKRVFFLKQEVKNIETMILNPAGSHQIPDDLINRPKFQECIQKTLYAQCFVKSGVEYYKWDDATFRGVIKARTSVFSMGINNNSYNRDGKVADWAWLSFKPNNNNNDFIVDVKNLVCKNK